MNFSSCPLYDLSLMKWNEAQYWFALYVIGLVIAWYTHVILIVAEGHWS